MEFFNLKNSFSERRRGGIPDIWDAASLGRQDQPSKKTPPSGYLLSPRLGLKIRNATTLTCMKNFQGPLCCKGCANLLPETTQLQTRKRKTVNGKPTPGVRKETETKLIFTIHRTDRWSRLPTVLELRAVECHFFLSQNRNSQEKKFCLFSGGGRGGIPYIQMYQSQYRRVRPVRILLKASPPDVTPYTQSKVSPIQ